MNFLAHCVLAGDDEDLIAGAIAGDFVKGRVDDRAWPGRVGLGIRLHRRIDAFSNEDNALRASAARFGAPFRRIAPPAVDVWADFLLAQKLASGELPTPDGNSFEAYADSLASIALTQASALPAACVEFLEHAKRSSLFRGYGQIARVERVIEHLCKRLGRERDAAALLACTQRHTAALEQDFADYWPRLRAEAKRFLKAEGSTPAQ